jgi:catechol 2,3-dioxygenase-like lactoylglutathione lyase family enzyme
MIDHFGINCADLDAGKAFYDAVLAPLGFSRQMDFGVAVGYGTQGHPAFWIGTFDGVGPNRETHVAFVAESAERVRAFHQAALGQGAETLHEPRIWPEYHDHYYGAFVRDPDGNNVEAVCHTADAGD